MRYGVDNRPVAQYCGGVPLGTIRLQNGKDRRIRSGHLWIFDGEIESIIDAVPGDIATVVSNRGVFLGKAMLCGSPSLRARVMTRVNVDVDEAFLMKALENCFAHKKAVAPDSPCFRLVNSEGDMLPGLIADVYEDVFVIQATTFGMDLRKKTLAGMISELLGTRKAYERSDMPIRKYEGLEPSAGFMFDQFDTKVRMHENGVLMDIDVAAGQKTGYYLDQRENRLAASQYAKGADVLDAFCYNGSFGLAAGLKGAKSLHFLDMSEPAIEQARSNASINGLDSISRFTVANAFDELNRLVKEGASYDLIMLDPPPFTRNKEAIEGAIRGYKEINLRGIKLTRPGGYLVTSSCSQHIGLELFKEVIAMAAADSGRYLQLVEARSQARDHSALLSMSETEYLKCLIFRVV
jgi:23S rRNA (cytosine1962-C5)-methyltransferase